MEVFVKKNDDTFEILKLSSDIFNVEYKEKLLYQLIVYCLSKAHVKTKSQKTRGRVRGGGIKPWKQKGTGRARVGSIRSPLWRGGGKIFASSGIGCSKKMNKKMYKLGIKVILSELFRKNRLSIINEFFIEKIGTKNLLNVIAYLKLKTPSLFIVDDLTNNMYLSSRNLKNVRVVFWKNLDPLILIKFDNIFVTKDAIILIEEAFK